MGTAHTIQMQRPPGTISTISVGQWLVAILFATLLVGYPIVGSLITLTGLDSATLSYPYRIFLACLSLILISSHILTRKWHPSILVLIFLSLYILRLLYDYFYTFTPNADRAFQFYISTVLFPVLGLSVAGKMIDERKMSTVILSIGLTSCLMIAFIQLSGRYSDSINLIQTGGRLSFDSLNAISISEAGLFTAIAGYARLQQSSLSNHIRIISILSIPLGVYILMSGGSRGPLLQLCAGVLLIAALGRQTWVVVGLTFVFVFLFYTTQINDTTMFTRMLQSGTDTSSLERLYVQQSTLALAMQNPLLGFAYVDPLTQSYPHNLLLESFLD